VLKRPVGRPPDEACPYYASFRYQAGSWSKPRRVVAKVEWHPRELCAALASSGSKRSRPRLRGRGYHADPVPPTRSAFTSYPGIQSRQFHANPGDAQGGGAVVADEPTRGKLIKIGTKVVSHARYVTFQTAGRGVAVDCSQKILQLIARLRAPPASASPADGLQMRETTTGGYALSTEKLRVRAPQAGRVDGLAANGVRCDRFFLRRRPGKGKIRPDGSRTWDGGFSPSYS
jgi:hypothetical protein